jgi:hypothetical protein
VYAWCFSQVKAGKSEGKIFPFSSMAFLHETILAKFHIPCRLPEMPAKKTPDPKL